MCLYFFLDVWCKRDIVMSSVCCEYELFVDFFIVLVKRLVASSIYVYSAILNFVLKLLFN